MKDIYLERENKFRKISVHSAIMISRQGPLSLSLLQQSVKFPLFTHVIPRSILNLKKKMEISGNTPHVLP